MCWLFLLKSWNYIIYFLLPNAHPWFLDNLVTKNILSFLWLLSCPLNNITLITHCLTNTVSHCSVCSRNTSQNPPILAYNCITLKQTLHLKQHLETFLNCLVKAGCLASLLQPLEENAKFYHMLPSASKMH